MTHPLDPLLAALRDQPPDTRLDQLELLVWAQIDRERPPQANAWRWRAGFAAVVLAAGVLAGGGAAATSGADVSPFAVNPAYAPSTLLEGDQ